MGHQIKNNCAAKSTIKKVKTQPTKWKKILQIIYLTEAFYLKIYKELLQLSNKKTNQILKW